MLEAGVAKSAITALKSKVKAARKKRNEKQPIDPGDVDPAKMLLIDTANLHQTAQAAYAFVLKGGEVYHSVVEGRTVRLSRGPGDSATVTIALNSDGMKIVIHNACRPYQIEKTFGVMVQVDCEIPDGIVRSLMNYYGSSGAEAAARNIRSAETERRRIDRLQPRL